MTKKNSRGGGLFQALSEPFYSPIGLLISGAIITAINLLFSADARIGLSFMLLGIFATIFKLVLERGKKK